MLTKQDITAFMREAGIKESDTVTIHCSLRAIGKIENGADGLIDGIRDYLRDGLFLVPTHTWRTVNRDNPYFDVKTSVPCIGTLAEVAAFRPDAVRSLHPTHSLAGFGSRAANYLQGEEHSASPAPLGGALNRLYEENGKILLVGVGHERNTYLHAVDERFDIPNRLHPDPFVITVKDQNGRETKTPPYRRHYTEGLPYCVSEHYPNLKAAFEYMGAVTYAQLGNALVYCCDARRMTDAIKRLWDRAGYDFFLEQKPLSEEFYKKPIL